VQNKFALITEIELKSIITTAVTEALLQYTSNLIPTSANSPPDPDYLISRKTVCEILNISLPTAAKLQKSGKIKAVTICGSYRYSKKHITDILNNKNKSGTN
jgi:hypothetical protein